MRVLFVATAGAHLPWITPLSWACQVAGHDVRVATRPAGVDFLLRAGLTVVPVGDEEALRRSQAAHRGLASVGGPRRLPGGWVSDPSVLPREVRTLLGTRQISAADTLTDDLVAFARSWRPDLIVYDTVNLAGLVAGAAVGVPAVGHTWGLSFGFSFADDPELRPAFAALFERFGVEPRFRPDMWIDPCPPSLRPSYPVPSLPMRLVPYNGPVTVPSWLPHDGSRPRVGLTGGVTTGALNNLLGRIAGAIQSLGAEVVTTVSPAQGITAADLPEGVRLLEQFPMNVLLPTCSAVVHHGGVGTGMITLAHGLPQVVLPHTAIQDHWAERIGDVGAGVSVDNPDGAGVEQIAAAVDAVLNTPKYGIRAQELRAENEALPRPARIVELLERYAYAHEVPTGDLVHA